MSQISSPPTIRTSYHGPIAGKSDNKGKPLPIDHAQIRAAVLETIGFTVSTLTALLTSATPLTPFPPVRHEEAIEEILTPEQWRQLEAPPDSDSDSDHSHASVTSEKTLLRRKAEDKAYRKYTSEARSANSYTLSINHDNRAKADERNKACAIIRQSMTQPYWVEMKATVPEISTALEQADPATFLHLYMEYIKFGSQGATQLRRVLKALRDISEMRESGDSNSLEIDTNIITAIQTLFQNQFMDVFENQSLLAAAIKMESLGKEFVSV